MRGRISAELWEEVAEEAEEVAQLAEAIEVIVANVDEERLRMREGYASIAMVRLLIEKLNHGTRSLRRKTRMDDDE